MTQIVSPVDQTLRSLSGRSFDLVAGVPTLIDPGSLSEALRVGCTEVGVDEPAPEAAPLAPIEPVDEPVVEATL